MTSISVIYSFNNGLYISAYDGNLFKMEYSATIANNSRSGLNMTIVRRYF